jgi:hypothetical protein
MALKQPTMQPREGARKAAYRILKDRETHGLVGRKILVGIDAQGVDLWQ